MRSHHALIIFSIYAAQVGNDVANIITGAVFLVICIVLTIREKSS